jgi:hypothetical protein
MLENGCIEDRKRLFRGWRVLFRDREWLYCGKKYSFNPILHTAWLDNRALSLKSNSAKYYFMKNPDFCIPS